MNEIVSSLTSAFTLAFVVTSMFSLGLSLTVKEILGSLKNVRLVLMSLVANFVIVPLVAYLLTRILPLDQDLQVGLLLISAAAGAPLGIKAAKIAKGDKAFAGSLVALQVVATVIYLPLILPLLIPGLEVDAVAIALPLLLQVLLPLAMGLLMKARYDEEAQMTRPIMGEISNISLALMIVLNLANLGDVLALIGTGSILAVLLVILLGAATGYLLGGPAAKTRRTLAVGTAQRNYAAAFTIATADFGNLPAVLLLVLAASLISMLLIIPLAGELGRRAKDAEASVRSGEAVANST